tara:strand:- start:1189 stop:1716 length:528 start_codon:yes stop_codon:yes gene_type:complete
MKLLLAGDSFAAKWPGKFLGWSERLEGIHDVVNLAQAGCGEYKILKQLHSIDLTKFEAVIISHTSPYRIHTAYHPLHIKDTLHQAADFIYEDVKGRLPDVENFFTEYFDLEYAIFIHQLIKKEIDTLISVTGIRVIDTDDLGLKKLFKTNRGNVQHLDETGNIEFYNKLVGLLKY